MPYEWCQQSGDCWLTCAFSDIDLTDLPRYRIGQIVESTYTDDETGETYRSRLQIVGMTIAVPGWLNIPGWWYFVLYLPGSDPDWLIGNPIAEEFHESDLRELS